MRISSDQCLQSEKNLATRERETFLYSTPITCSIVLPGKASTEVVNFEKKMKTRPAANQRLGRLAKPELGNL